MVKACFNAWRGPHFRVQQGQYFALIQISKNGQNPLTLAKVTNGHSWHSNACLWLLQALHFFVSSLLSI